MRNVRIQKKQMKTLSTPEQDLVSYTDLSEQAKSKLTKLAAWIDDRHIPFLVISIGMIVMLLWAGAYKMTAPGAEGIVPLVSNSPLVSWQFKLFGTYIGSDLIGLTEWIAAILFIAGYLKPKAGIVGGLIAAFMFFTTSTMIITTPGTTSLVHGMRYMSFLSLFLFKDVISVGASLYLISYFGKNPFCRKTKQIKADETLVNPRLHFCVRLFVPAGVRQTGTEGTVGWHMGSSIRRSRLLPLRHLGS